MTENPPLTDLIGLDPNFTDGLSVEEHLRSQCCNNYEQCKELEAKLTEAERELYVLRNSESLELVKTHRLRECHRVVEAAKAWRIAGPDDYIKLHAATEALYDAVDALDLTERGEHPEARCRRCGTPNSNDWSAPSPLWNEVMRGGDINGDEPYSGIICPTCFMILTQEAGIASSWRLHATQVHRPLQTVTPSGRTWNEQTWMWEEPGP